MSTDFRKSTVYQIYPKSFCDTNNDGLGDLRGVIEKLDYIKELGVDYIWLTPFFVSPQNDNGYDVEDYYNIDPRYGTMADVEELIAEAGKRGIGLMFDMVFNHVSTRHEWFRKAMEGDPDCGGLLSYGYFSGENITHMEEGRPLFVRTPKSNFNLANFMRVHLFTALGALKVGMDILFKEENVQADKILGHGGLFKTKGVGQKIMAAALNTPVSV